VSQIEVQVTELLNQLLAVQEQVAARAEPYDKKVQELQLAKAAAIGEELPKQESEITKAIKALAVTIGHTVRGDGLQAVWSKGRESWDTSKLEGYIAGIPDRELQQALLGFKKVGNPSVSIRIAKQQGDTGDLF
jgi:hypothetical protein